MAKPEIYGYSLYAGSARGAFDVAARFYEGMIGPMRDGYAGNTAQAIGNLLAVDPELKVRPIIVPIDPISMSPDYDAVEHEVIIYTTVPVGRAEAMMQASYDPTMSELERMAE